MEKMKLSPPWFIYVNKLQALFKSDKDITFNFDEENYALKIYVADEEKAEALTKLLPMQKEFGNVVVNISIIPPNEVGGNLVDVFRKAFKNNPDVVDIFTAEGIFSNPINYVIFKKEVVQFFNDDLGDAHGVRSTLSEELAREVFGTPDGIYFCTDVDDGVGHPLGEV